MAPRDIYLDADGNETGRPRTQDTLGNMPSSYPSNIETPPASTGNLNTLPTGSGYDNWWRQFYMGQADQTRPGVSFLTNNQSQARNEQQRVIQDLQRAAAGDMNSQAQQQLRQGYGSAMGQQASLGSSMRGQSAGAAMRGIQQGQAGIQRGFAGDQQMLKLQEQQAAQAMLAQMLAQQQGQDITQAQGLASATLGSQGLDDARRQFYLGGAGQSDINATEWQNAIARAQLGFQDQMNALTSGMVNAGVQGAATGAGTLMQFGGKKGFGEN